MVTNRKTKGGFGGGGRTPLFLEENRSGSDVIEVITSSLLNIAHPIFFCSHPPGFRENFNSRSISDTRESLRRPWPTPIPILGHNQPYLIWSFGFSGSAPLSEFGLHSTLILSYLRSWAHEWLDNQGRLS